MLSAQQSSLDLAIDTEETIGKSFEVVDASVRAILVRRDSAGGAVRIFGREVKNIVTGPKESGYALVAVGADEECMFLGSPSVRYLRLRVS